MICKPYTLLCNAIHSGKQRPILLTLDLILKSMRNPTWKMGVSNQISVSFFASSSLLESFGSTNLRQSQSQSCNRQICQVLTKEPHTLFVTPRMKSISFCRQKVYQSHCAKNVFFVHALFRLGSGMGNRPWLTIILSIAVCLVCSAGMVFWQVNTDDEAMWTPYGSSVSNFAYKNFSRPILLINVRRFCNEMQLQF